MIRIATFSLAAIALAVSAFAQVAPPARPAATGAPTPTVVGATAEVTGLVTVSYGAQVASVTNNSPVIDQSRYVTSSSGRVILRYKDGCNVELGPNQWVEVDGSRDCDARIAMIQAVGDSSAVAGILSGNGGRLLGVALLLAAGADARRNSGGASAGGVTNPGILPEPPVPTPPPSQ